MLPDWTAFTEFLDAQLLALIETDFAQVRYGDAGTATLAALVLVAAALLTAVRLILLRRRHARQHSGHDVPLRYQRGIFGRTCYALPKIVLGLAVAMGVVALSDPFLTSTEQITGNVESRVRIDLVDTSLSMAWEFNNTERSRAEVAREAHLEFLRMRREKNDRVSLWLFSSYPYMVDDFVLDDELYYFQVLGAPYVTVKILAPEPGTRRDRFFVPEERVSIIDSEGTTNITGALRSIVRHFDIDATVVNRGANRNRALLIITDADVDEIPEAELAALAARNVVPYIIYINTDRGRSTLEGIETPSLIESIREYGGDYFDVSTEDGLQQAYRAIDERETVAVPLSHRALRVPIYSRFLLVSLALLVVGIPAGFLAELVWGIHP
ncbi:MAG: hypothetical protein OXQ28_02065 [Acidobacteriota bacterium]|nr:hypothetical protein [Acidobacteriota bacterium]